MTKSGAPLAVRTSAAGQFGAVLFLALGLFVACGNDTPIPGDEPGQGGRGNSAGRTGKGGEGADAGQDDHAGAAGVGPDGSAGDSSMPETGGGAGKGGTAGTSGTTGGSGGNSAGKGGMGGMAGGSTGPVCGNNKLETGEVCDDGNTVFGDTCSPTCTNVCEKCEKDVCGGPDADTFGDYDSCFGDGFLPPNDVAKTGPKAGTKKNVLCPALIACLKRTGCAQYDPEKKLVSKCYCGTASATDCAMPGKPNGACFEEIAAAGESRLFSPDLVQRQNSPQYALGLAYRIYGACDGALCAQECVLGKAKTECQTCISSTLGTVPEASANCYVNASQNPKFSAPLCSAALECAHRTGCARNGLGSCYGVLSNTTPATLATPGPCAAEFTAAGEGHEPGLIMTEILNPNDAGTISAVGAELNQEFTACKDVCFPISSGGQGGNGGAGGSGGISGIGGATGGTGG